MLTTKISLLFIVYIAGRINEKEYKDELNEGQC